MDNNLENSEGFKGLNHIISDATRGIFFVIASHKLQKRIADVYAADNLVKMDYANTKQYRDLRLYDDNKTEHYTVDVLKTFLADNLDKRIYFVLNFQIPFSTPEDLFSLNETRDTFLEKKRIWIFFITPELENRLYISAPDFHSNCSVKLEFEDTAEERADFERIDLSEIILTELQINEIKQRLADYEQNEEKEYASYFDATADGEILLRREGISDNKLLADTATLANMAEFYRKIGDYGKAIETSEKVAASRVEVLGNQHIDTAIAYNSIGNIYEHAGAAYYDKALEYHNKALDIQKKTAGLQHPDTIKSYYYIGTVYNKMGDYSKALKYFTAGLEIQKKLLGVEHIDTVESFIYIGVTYNSIGDYNKSLKYLFTALEIQEKLFGTQHIDTAKSYNYIGIVYQNLFTYNKALEYYNKALEVREKLFGLQHPDAAKCYNHIGNVYADLGNYNKALEYYNKALEIFEKVLEKDHVLIENILESMENAKGNL